MRYQPWMSHLSIFSLPLQQTRAQWNKVFWTCVPIYVVAGVFYLAFASTSLQPWNFRAAVPLTEENAGQIIEEAGGRGGENEDESEENV